MIRLYSYAGLYGFLFVPPVSALAATIWAVKIGDRYALIGFSILSSVFLLFWLFTFRRCKRVYYDRSSLYVYEPFSKKQTIVSKDNIGSINKILSYDPRFYKIVYYDDNRDTHYIYFQRNWFLSDFENIVDKIDG
jgi:hypothetical protein